MNVAIVGNSNCVFRNGFFSGVERYVASTRGVVRNFSLGGSCCALHIYTLHDKYTELCDSDVVILDSLVIDTFHWKRGIICHAELVSLIDDMYALYSQLPAKVVSVLFPIEKHVQNYRQLPTYQAHIDSARRYGVDVVDLFSLLPPHLDDYSGYFAQPGHINADIADEAGYRVASICGEITADDVAVRPLRTPYEAVNEEVFGVLDGVSVESSYYKANCFRLDRDVKMERYSGKNLVGLFHWNKTALSKFVLSSENSEDVIQFRSKYAFFEVLNARRMIRKNTIARPGHHGDRLTQRPAGKMRQAEYDVPQLVGMLVRSDEEVAGNKVDMNSDLSGLLGDVFR